MARQFNCVSCSKKFNSTERFVKTSAGQCPTCLKKEGMPRVCISCQSPFIWHEHFANVVGHPDRPQTMCPTCCDRFAKMADPDQPVIKERKALHVIPLARVDINMEFAEVHDPGGKATEGRNPPVRLIMKDKHGKSYDGRIDIYDYRPSGQRFFGSLARVRVMEATHAEGRTLQVRSGVPLGPKHTETLEFSPTYQYIVLEPLEEGTDASLEPPIRLIAASYSGKSALKGGKTASGGVAEDHSQWSTHLTSQSRSGAHYGGTLVALVDDEHPVLIRQDNCLWREGRSGKDLDEPGFRESGVARLTCLIPDASEELVDSLNEQGFKAKLIRGNSAAVRLRREDGVEGFILPPSELVSAYELRVETAEYGGGYTSSGHAQVVADQEGQPLSPYATAGHRGHLMCGTHGWFSAQDGLCTIQASVSRRSPPRISLAKHTVQKLENSVQLVSEVLFEGLQSDLPDSLQTFDRAVRAAVEKASDFHCRNLYFADGFGGVTRLASPPSEENGPKDLRPIGPIG